MSDKLVLYYDVNTDNLYNAKGALYGNAELSMFLNNKLSIEMHYVEDVSANEPEAWVGWSGLKDLAVGSTIAFDDNYTHAVKGTLSSAVSVGGTSVSVTANISTDNLNPSDKLIVYKADGTAVTLLYTEYTNQGNTYTFTLKSASTVALAEGSSVRVPEALLLKCSGDSIDDTRAGEGIFTFDIYAMSHKILNRLDYTSTQSISGTMEHQIKSEGSIIRTFTYPFKINNLMDYENGVNVPSQTGDWVDKTYVKSFFEAGEVYQYSTDGNNWHDTRTDADIYYRSKLNTTNGVWGAKRDLIKGSDFKIDATGTYETRSTYDESPAGFSYLVISGDKSGMLYFKKTATSGDWGDGIKFVPDGLSVQYSTDGETWTSTYSSNCNYYRFSVDGGNTWGSAIKYKTEVYLYVAYASDGYGSDFSLTPSNNLPYRAEIISYTKIDNPTATDFITASWVKYIGSSAYLYVAYANNDSGGGFSLTPSDTLPYRAELHSSVAISNLSSTDFANATWVKYIGSGILTGKGEPTDSIGIIGDIYIDQNTNRLYKKTVSDTWASYSTFGIRPDAIGTIGERAQYDQEAKGFLYFCTDTVTVNNIKVQYMYMKQSSSQGDWSEGFYFGGVTSGPKGDKGEPGADTTSFDPVYFYTDDTTVTTPGQTYVYVQTGTNNSKYIVLSNTSATTTSSTVIPYGTALVGAVELKAEDGTWQSVECSDSAGVDKYMVKVNITDSQTYIYLGTSLDLSRGGRVRFAQGVFVKSRTYVAYASDDAGSDFSLIPDNTLPYRAEVNCTKDVYNPNLEFFQSYSAKWIRYIAPSVWYSGETAPDASKGDNNDWYINTVTYDVYQKVSGAWVVKCNIKGATGEVQKWMTGSTAPTAEQGSVGDFYFNTANNKVYTKGSSGWSELATLKGDTGAGINLKGTWSSSVTYAVADMVTYQGSSYIATTANTNKNPATSTTDWTMYIQKGEAGAAGSLEIGTVNSGTTASATITGTAPNQKLNLVLPKGSKGDKGDPGSSNTLTIGTVTGGTEAAATITGTSPNQVLNLVLPKGEKGNKGDAGEKLEGNYIDVTSSSIDGHLVVPDDSIPVSVEINGVNYDLDDGTVLHDTANYTYKIPIAFILAQANLSGFSGTWRVWRAGGKAGTNGGSFTISLVENLPETLDPNVLYLLY